MRTPQSHDWDLIRQYARQGSQAAFDEIVRRHIKLVYSTCNRELSDPWLAEDVTQVVFVILSRKAGMLPPGTILSRWLFKTARFASKDVRKREARRKAREARLLDQTLSAIPSSGISSALESALLSALESLGRSDWEAVQMRFYQEMSLKEIGEACGVSEDAAQKRVARAVDRIRRSITHEGIALTAVTIATLIESEDSQAAKTLPLIDRASSISKSIHSTALAGQSKIYGLAKGVLTAMALKNMATAAIVLGVALVAGAPLIVQGQNNAPAPAPGSLATGLPAHSAPVTASSAAPNIRPLTIVLDPGHGGNDSGATSNGAVRVQEKDLNWAIALKLYDILTAKGVHASLTRAGDVVSLPSARAKIGILSHADFFVSIHCDSTARESASGTTVYYHAQNQAAKALATSVLNSVAKQGVLTASGVKSDTIRFKAGFEVLRDQPSKAILIQCGYMTNHLDLAALTDPEQQTRIAQGIADGLSEAGANRK